MDSSELEKKASRERDNVAEDIREIDETFSPGRLLDKYYFQGEASGLTGYIKKMKDDPVPGALVGAAILWSANREQMKSSAYEAVDRAKGMASEAQRKVDESTGKLKEKASQSAQSGQEKAQEYKEKATSQLKEHPFMNMALGFSLGAALGGLTPLSSQEEKVLEPAAEKALQAKDRAIDEARSRIES